MRTLEHIFKEVIAEYKRSNEKHCDWTNLDDLKQAHAVRNEFEEWQRAFLYDLPYGPHGEVSELIQVINVACKRILYLEEKRHAENAKPTQRGDCSK